MKIYPCLKAFLRQIPPDNLSIAILSNLKENSQTVFPKTGIQSERFLFHAFNKINEAEVHDVRNVFLKLTFK